MRLAWVSVAVVLFTACAPNVRPCAEGTLFVSVALDAQTKQADHLQVQISVGAGAPMLTTLDHVVGKDRGSIEIQFPNGYPVGQTIHVTLIALAGGSTLGQATFEATLTAGCGAAEIAVGASGAPDLAGTDIVLPIDLTPSPPDLVVPSEAGVEIDLAGTEIDLAGTDIVLPVVEDLANPTGADLTCTPITENCFNGIDDDCDQLPDCADPDCNATAICVPEPTGSYKVGTKLSGVVTCPATLSTTTTLKSGFSDVTCGLGSCGCPSSTHPGSCLATIGDNGSNSFCSTGSYTNVNETEGCKSFPQIPNGNFHKVFADWLGPSSCETSGFPQTVPASFAAQDTFCSRASVVRGGCALGEVCAPKQAAQCVVAPGNQSSCPTGYTKDTTSYFTGHDGGRSCLCYCSMTPGTCSEPPLYADSSCMGPEVALLVRGCSSSDFSSYQGLGASSVATGGSCGDAGSPSYQTQNVSTPTGQQTVCCAP